jgi:uncharacterized protein YndB with AHSA1/START domain
MAQFNFLTTWDLEAPIEKVWETLSDLTGYSNWWKYVASVTEVEPIQADGTGGMYIWNWKTALPYNLKFGMRMSRYEPPHVIESNAEGELEGVGRWDLQQMEGFTRVTYAWQVRTTKSWMNLVAPLAHPAFSWNHNVLMDEGGRALAEHLGVRLLAFGNKSIKENALA